LQKEVDKLKKKMSELNEFDESAKYRIDEMSDVNEEPSKDEDPLDEIYRERARPIRGR
jgi:FtsZ-binding cell division protein ZapB